MRKQHHIFHSVTVNWRTNNASSVRRMPPKAGSFNGATHCGWERDGCSEEKNTLQPHTEWCSFLLLVHIFIGFSHLSCAFFVDFFRLLPLNNIVYVVIFLFLYSVYLLFIFFQYFRCSRCMPQHALFFLRLFSLFIHLLWLLNQNLCAHLCNETDFWRDWSRVLDINKTIYVETSIVVLWIASDVFASDSSCLLVKGQWISSPAEVALVQWFISLAVCLHCRICIKWNSSAVIDQSLDTHKNI